MKILKKHKYKLLTLMLSIVSIFTLFLGINNIYAYTTDKISYTIDSDNIVDTTNYRTTITYQDTYIDIVLNNRDYYDSVVIDLPLLQQTTFNSNYLLMNFDCFYSTDGGTNWSSIKNYLSGSNILNFSFYYTSNSVSASYRIINSSANLNNNIYNNKNYYTFISGTTTSNSTLQQNVYFRKLFTDLSGLVPSNYKLKFRIYNIDFVPNYDIGLQQYYETYYGQIEDNYNALLSDYNTLQDNYDTLETNYNTLNSDYQDLNNNYNTLQTNYSNLQQEIDSIYNLGSLYFVQYVFIQTTQNNQNYSKSWTQSELINGNYYNGIHLKIGNLIDYIKRQNNLSLTENYKIIIQFNKSLLIDNFDIIMGTTNYANLQSVDITIYNANPMENENAPSFTVNIPFSNSTLEINKELISQNTNHELDNKYINRLNFTYNNIRDTYNLNISSNIEIDQTQYNLGFNNGQVNAKNEYLPIIRELEQQEVNKTNEINNLNTQLETLQAQYEDLNDRYNRVSNPNNTLYSMVVSIADVPLHVFKQIFNFDILGINISTFVLSLVSLLIIIWLIKKII